MIKPLRLMRRIFLYCGSSREEYQTIRKDAYEANFSVWKIFHLVMIFVMFVMMCTNPPGLFEGADSTLFFPRTALFLYSILMTVLFFCVLKPDGITGQLCIYLTMALLLSYGLFSGLYRAQMPATVFVLLLVLLPSFMIDKPYFMAILLSIAGVTYITFACFVKSGEVLHSDIIYVVIFTLVGILINTLYNMLRVREFLLKKKDLAHAEEEKHAYAKAYDLYSVISAITDDYDILAGIHYDADSIEYFRAAPWTDIDPVKQKERAFDANEITRFADTHIYPEDRELFKENMRKERMLSSVSGGAFTFRFRCNRLGSTPWYELRALWQDDGTRSGSVIAGIRNIDKEVREETEMLEQKHSLENARQTAVIAELSKDFGCIVYTALNGDRYSDSVRLFRMSDRLKKLVPGWEEETCFHNWLEMFLRYAVAPADKGLFFDASRRDVILSAVEKESIYQFNFRVLSDGELVYHLIKFVADRDAEGTLQGFIVGVRSVDADMRDRIRHEEELTAINERAEHTIARRTAELREKNAQLMQTGEEIIELLGDVVEMRDSGSGMHVRRVKTFTHILAERVKEDLPEYHLTDRDVTYITGASALHDIGKIMISDTILLKPARLTSEEFDIMKTHCEKGCEVLRRAPRNWDKEFVVTAMDVCRFHHEKWNGGGYPMGLKGDDIPISAQIVSIADCFDALTSARPYKEAYDGRKAIEMILCGECGAYSEKLMDCFRACADTFCETLHNPGLLAVSEVVPEHGYIHGTRLSGIHILLVDDSELSLSLNEEILRGESATVVTAKTGTEAVETFLTKGPFDAVLLDLMMPGMDGFVLAERLRSSERRSPVRTPIIALTAENSTDNSAHALRCGIDACLSKPLLISDFTRALLDCMRRRNESIGQMLSNTLASVNTDALTHVKSITAYTDMVSNLSAEIHSFSKPEFAIVMCDLNNLKRVNDTYGHDVGDIFIRNCCHLICDVFSASPVYRIGGDEFVVLLRGLDFVNRDALLQTLSEKVAQAQSEADFEHGRASLAAGISVFNPAEDVSVSDVVKRADKSMYRNKSMMRQTAAAR